MRVALLSTMESVAAAGGDPRGFLTVAGRSVIQHQLDCALALGCERIACQAIGLPNELLEMQHLAEGAGAQFQVISGSRALSGMVRATDELLVFADGLLPDRVLAEKLLGDRPAVMVLPADEGIAAGFERIDREYAWAGLYMVRGPAVERLADLPPDADPIAGLLRIALQAGTRIVSMPPGILAGREWGLAQSEEDAAEFEQVWLDRYVRPASFAAPSLAIADRAATWLMRRSDARKFGSNAILTGAAVLGAIAGLAGWFWQPIFGIVLLALTYLALRIGGALRSIERLGRAVGQGSGRIISWLGAALDVLLIGLAGLTSSGSGQITVILGMAGLLMTLRLGQVLPLGNWKILLADRTLLVIALSIAAYFSQLIIVLQLLTIISLSVILFDANRSKLTRT